MRIKWAASGAPLPGWPVDIGAPGWVTATPAVAGGLVYVGTTAGDHKMCAFDATTGATVWSLDCGDRVYNSSAVVGGLVYFGMGNGRLHAVNATTGAIKWLTTMAAGIWFASPAVANGVVYVRADSGMWGVPQKLYAVNAATGAPLWGGELTGNPEWTSSPVVVNGMVYIGGDWNMKAFKLGTTPRPSLLALNAQEASGNGRHGQVSGATLTAPGYEGQACCSLNGALPNES